MKKISQIIVLLLFILSANANNIYIIYFGDTYDSKIGGAILTDIRLMDRLASQIKSIASTEGYTFIYHKYVGRDCSSSQLKNVISNLSCNNDIVFFYYGGHGGRSHEDKGIFPRMCLGSNYIDQFVKVSDVMEQLKSKRPRLYVMVTDCCNSFYDRKGESASLSLESSSMDKTLKHLLFEQTGYVSITAASPGQYGWCNQNGSYLTISLLSFLKSYNSKDVSSITWNSICKDITNDVRNTTTSLYRSRFISKYQTPGYEVCVTDDAGSNDIVPPYDNDNNSDNNVSDSIDDGAYNDIIDNPRHDNDNDHRRDNDRTHSRKRYGSLPGFILLIVLGYLLLFKLSRWLQLEGRVSTIVKIVGFILIIKALIDLLLGF